MSPYRSISKTNRGSSRGRSAGVRASNANESFPWPALIVGAVIGIGIGFGVGYGLRFTAEKEASSGVMSISTPRPTKDWRPVKEAAKREMVENIRAVGPGATPDKLLEVRTRHLNVIRGQPTPDRLGLE